MTSTVYFVRHGHIIMSEGKNNSDWELSVRGIEEITKLAKRLKKISPVAIVSSHYLRTLQSAHILGKVLNLKVHTEKSLHEVFFKRTVKHAKEVFQDVDEVIKKYIKTLPSFIVVSHEAPISLYLSKESGKSYYEIANDHSNLQLLKMGECIEAIFENGKFVSMKKF